MEIYNNRQDGVLYYASDGGTAMEMDGNHLIVKFRATKFTDWKTLADEIFEEMSALSFWGYQRAEDNAGRLSPIVGKDKKSPETFFPFFEDGEGWQMYMNDDAYLFVYDYEFKDEPPVADATDFAFFCYKPLDALGGMTTFLHEWYLRTNGYPEDR